VLELLGTVEAGELPGGELVVFAHGLIDERISTSLREKLMPLTHPNGSPLFLDLEGAHGLDAAAMSVIADAAHVVRDNGAQLGIVTRSPIVLRLISDAGLDDVVAVSPSLSKAIAR
jgi:anti-anti-sigma factor